MSTPMPAPDLPPTDTTVVRGRSSVTVSVYETYAEAQRAVDFLSDSKFPVEHVNIVGTDLRLVENVLGRWTVPRAAGAGALTGAWFGLLVGLLLSIFSDSGWLGIIVVAILIGAIWGAVFGAVAQAATRGQRDFTSRSTLQASRYAVMVSADQVDDAWRVLSGMQSA
jgi:ascorbate-specific PTS system EIIC-type component UlaA